VGNAATARAEIRRERGLSIADVARQIGVTPTTLAKSVSVRRLPTNSMQTRVAAWLAETEAKSVAPEVVPAEVTFPGYRDGNGAGNGADHHVG
jgi:transcriptional regulator with XRE-family HTH domain